MQVRVDAAIERGAAWLAARQAEDGTWGWYQTQGHTFGLTALCMQTLATCGRGAKDPAIQAGQAVLDRELGGRLRVMATYGGGGSIITYGAAAALLYYEALYGDPRPAAVAPAKPLSTRVRRHVTALADWLLASDHPSGWRYPYTNADGEMDISNTVYALMGLHAAARLGYVVEADEWAKAARNVLAGQARDGPLVRRWLPNAACAPWLEGSEPYTVAGEDSARGWGYTPRVSTRTGSQTSAGVAALAITREHLLRQKALTPELRAEIEPAMLSGIAWLGEHFDPRTNPGPDGLCWHVYGLYGLERAGALSGMENFGRHDWYREGADVLLEMQQSGGGWHAAAPDVRWAGFQPAVVQTCFALLFLKRGTRMPGSPLGSTLTTR
jgi:hypothetical protein